jgi:hypothetical protein
MKVAQCAHRSRLTEKGKENMILRLAETDRAALSQLGGRPFEPMPGRPMREHMAVPAGIRESPSELRSWLVKAQSYAASLPPKRAR